MNPFVHTDSNTVYGLSPLLFVSFQTKQETTFDEIVYRTVIEDGAVRHFSFF